jgi:hypothetical protein
MSSIASQIALFSQRSNVRVEQRAAVLWMLALYPSRVCSNALLGDEVQQPAAGEQRSA